MEKERQAKIALLILKQRMRTDGIPLKPIKKKELRRKARVLGISVKEAREFSETIIREMVSEMFPPKKKEEKK